MALLGDRNKLFLPNNSVSAGRQKLTHFTETIFGRTLFFDVAAVQISHRQINTRLHGPFSCDFSSFYLILIGNYTLGNLPLLSFCFILYHF